MARLPWLPTQFDQLLIGELCKIEIDGPSRRESLSAVGNRCITVKTKTFNAVQAPIGVLLKPSPRHHDKICKGSVGWAERLQTALLHKVFPHLTSQDVRGNDVAADLMVQALLSQGTMEAYEFFVASQFEGASRNFLNNCPKGNNVVIRLHGLDVLMAGLDRFQLKAWFSPNDGLMLPVLLRKAFATRIYPITALSHGFSFQSLLYDCFLRILLSGTYLCDSIICTSRASREAMSNIMAYLTEHLRSEYGTDIQYSGRLDLIPLCIDTARFRPQEKSRVRRQLNLPMNAFVFLFLGRISSLKADLIPFIQVFDRLVKSNPQRELLFVIAGTEHPPYTGFLREYLVSLGLQKRVRILCNISDTTKEHILSAADVFVSPADNIQESFGLAPIEAMACGVPQVVTDWNGYKDTVSHGETGFLVPTLWKRCNDDLVGTHAILGWQFDHHALGQSVAFDMKAMFNFLQAMIDNEELRREMGVRSRKRAEALFSFSAVVKQYEELWSELTAVAQSINFQLPLASYERPAYYDFFGHYATASLSENDQLHLTDEAKQFLCNSGKLHLYPELSNLKIIEESLLRRILTELWDSQRPSVEHKCVVEEECGSLSLFNLVNSICNDENRHPDFIMRHVMWLIKHGFIETELGADLFTQCVTSEKS